MMVEAPRTIPPALVERRRWLEWQPGDVDPKTGKYPKIPINASGRPISDKEARNWRRLAAVAQRERIGFALGDGISGIDLDHCRDPETGEIDAWAWAIIKQAASYTEVSPSGTGVKIWVFGDAGTFQAKVEGKGRIEVYNGKQFFTFTGEHLDGTPDDVQLAQRALDDLRARFVPVTPSSDAEPATTRQTTTSDNESARDIIARFNADNPLPELLKHYGCKLISGRGDLYYFSGFPGDSHTHNITIKVRKKGGQWRCWSFSGNSRITTANHGEDAFDIECRQSYSGNCHEALKALSRTTTTQRWQHPIPEAPEPSPEVIARRAADAERKRQSRVDHATATLQEVRERAERDDLPTCEAYVLAEMLSIAGTRNWCRPSIQALCKKTEYGRTRVKQALHELERRGYFVTDEHITDAGVPYQGGKSTPIRTFLRGHSASASDPMYINNYDHDTCFVSSSEGGQAQPSDAPAPAVETVALDEQPAAVACKGGASFDPAAALAFVDKPYSERCKANLSPDEHNDGLRTLLADYRAAHPQVDDQADTPEADQVSLLDDPQPVGIAQPIAQPQSMLQRRHTRRTQRQRRTLFDLPSVPPTVAVVASSCPPLEEKAGTVAQTFRPDSAAALPQEERGASWRLARPTEAPAAMPTIKHRFTDGWDGIEERARLAALTRKS